MWDEDGNDFNGQAGSEAGLGSLGFGQSELMYGTFSDPSMCGSSVWTESDYNYQHHHHQQPANNSGGLQLHHQTRAQEDEDETATAVACIEAANTGVSSTEREAAVQQHQSSYYDQAPTGNISAHPHCQLPIPELSSWWSPDGRLANAGVHSLEINMQQQHQQQHQQQQHHHQQQQQQPNHQPLETASEREFIIVRKAKTSIGAIGSSTWDGGAPSSGAESAVVYECRICGRQCRWRSSISVHVRTHTGRKPYQCRVCHQRFADSSTRKKHEKKTHGCVIPSNKKTGGIEDQLMVSSNLSSQQHNHHQQQHQLMQTGILSQACHLCFALLPSAAELTKHLYEFHNQLMPAFPDNFGEAADDVPVLGSSKHQQPQQEPDYLQQATSDGWPDRILSEFDDPSQPDLQQQQQPPQLNQGIPLPSVPQRHDVELDQNIGAIENRHHYDGWRIIGDSVSASMGTSGGAGDQNEGAVQDSLYPYEIGYLGRDLHGIESILEDGRLTSYNQHLEFDKLDW